ncbi:MAG TPA: hypothetical protein VGK75_11630 [Casimicrobiaceae bacterium]|jgi:hypothetical protein
MTRTYRLWTTIIAVTALVAFAGPGVSPALAKAHKHHSGHQMLGNKVKQNGDHVIDKVGDHTVSAKVSNGKIAGVNVKHSKKGDVPVKKYKTKKKMAQTNGIHYASYTLAQYQDIGTTYIGYAFIDDFGDEQIYWFPYEMILDGDTGAIEYVPLT